MIRRSQKVANPAVRVLRGIGRVLLGVLRVVFLVLLIFMPIPMVLRPHVPKPDRRNLPTEVMRKD